MAKKTNEVIINEELIDFEIQEYSKLYDEVLLPITHLFQFNSETHFVHKDKLLPIVNNLQETLLMIEKHKNELLDKKNQ